MEDIVLEKIVIILTALLLLTWPLILGAILMIWLLPTNFWEKLVALIFCGAIVLFIYAIEGYLVSEHD